MVTRSDVLKRLVGQLHPMGTRPTVANGEVDFHLLSVILLLSTRGDVLNETFPLGGDVNPAALYAMGVDKRVTKEMVSGLRTYREAFATMQVAWLDLSGYTDPPCPDDVVSKKIVESSKQWFAK